MTNIEQYLIEKGLEYKATGNNQLNIKKCVFCGQDKWYHFYINAENGLNDCKKCQYRGNFNKFREFFGDTALDLSKLVVDSPVRETIKKQEYRALHYDIPKQYAARLWRVDERFRKYLLEHRKLTQKVLEEFQVGSQNGTAISIPIYENDVLINIQYRRDPDLDNNPDAAPRYASEKGCKSGLFNGDILREPLKEVIVTEGIFDALQLIQLGWKNTVSGTLGAGYFPESWQTKFKDVKTVYVVYDQDEAGILGAKKVADVIGLEKCKYVALPRKEGRSKTDITNYFVDDGGTKESFEALLKKARSFYTASGESIKHISFFTDELRKIILEGRTVGMSTGYPKLDEVMGGLRGGRLIVLSGLTSVGKSSFAQNIVLQLVNRKIPIFYFSLEMPPIDIAKKLLMVNSKLTGKELETVNDDSKILEKLDKGLLEFKGGKEGDKEVEALPIYLYNGAGMVKFPVLSECARIVREEYNVQFIVVDHLHYFAHSQGQVTQETAEVVRNIKQLAVTLDIPILLLAHLHRAGRMASKKGFYVPPLSDLRDSGSIEQDADQVLFVCRDSESDKKEEKEYSCIKVAKNRDGKAGSLLPFKFYEDITFFEEVKTVVYDAPMEEAAKKEFINDDPLSGLSISMDFVQKDL